MKAWIRFWGRPGEAFVKELEDALTRGGLSLVPSEMLDGDAPGLLVFEEADSSLLAAAGSLSGQGRKRVLGIAARGAGPTAEETWRLLGAGVTDVLVLSETPDPAASVLTRIERWLQVDNLVDTPLVRKNLVGTSSAWRSLLRQVVEVARFTDAGMLLMGESGTGKEMLARLIHTLDPRPGKGELVIVDCSSIVPGLAGSEFFGHERGSFTGAVGEREGAFALAHGGTLFLDEIGELPLPLQSQLLRVVQEHSYKRVGGNAWQRSDFRLLCATNRDLFESAGRGEFRSDLLHRIASWTFFLPPLRDRPEDILPLATHFAKELVRSGPVPEFGGAVRRYLCERDYRGNVRELRQLVARMVQRHAGTGPITAGAVPPDDRPARDPGAAPPEDALERFVRMALGRNVGLKEIGRRTEEIAVRIVLGEEGGSIRKAARRLGVTARALQLRRSVLRRRNRSQDAD